MSASSINHLVLAAIGLYILVQRWLRCKRTRDATKRFGYPERSLSTMTDKEAQEIQAALANLEFPMAFKKALEFGIFRTYGIPSISKLLVKTKQLSVSDYAPKRYADTTVLVEEIYGHPPTDPRVREAFGRLNYIHGVYLKSGQITNDDMLYTLSLFAWEPIKWINQLEWRQLSEVEHCAIGTFNKSMGDAMEISYDTLPSYKDGWDDGIHFLKELGDWAETYEQRCMLPHKDNRQTAEKTTELLVRMLPKFLRPFGQNIVTAIMDERLRKAMMYDKPPRGYKLALDLVLSFRKYFHRYVALPRPEFFKVQATTDVADRDGRYFLHSYDAYPFYVKPSLSGRWSPEAWIRWAAGTPLPGDEGEKYQPQGYKIEEIGPKSFLGMGAIESNRTQEKLAKGRTGGCPFVVTKT